LPTETATPARPTASAVSEIELRTYSTLADVGCDSMGVEDPVFGALEGAIDDPAVVWLRDVSGTRMDVVWPAGFVARFDPEVSLLSDQRERVATAGDSIYAQVRRSSAAGTTEDPYFATGFLAAGDAITVDDPLTAAGFAGCYGRRR
jgi:hypothetical protein